MIYLFFSLANRGTAAQQIHKFLSEKYYYRRWYVAIYSNLESQYFGGRNNHWFHICDGIMSMKKMKWGNDDLVVLIATTDKAKMTKDGCEEGKDREIQKADKEAINGNTNLEEAKGVYESLPVRIKTCLDYPIVIVTKQGENVDYAAHREAEKCRKKGNEKKYHFVTQIKGKRSDDDRKTGAVRPRPKVHTYEVNVFG